MDTNRKKIKILAVDDEPLNLDILTEYLEAEEFEVITALGGELALEKLTTTPEIDLIVLDRMMPNLNGMEVIRLLKKDERYRHIPIIMQTAAAQSSQILEGIQAGVYYYLTKPYDENLLVGIIHSALREMNFSRETRNEGTKYKEIPSLMSTAEFQFSTISQAKALAHFIANAFPDPEKALYGLTELMLNAIEHGNLGITYAEKKKLLLSGKLWEEIDRRLTIAENKHKYVKILFESKKEVFRISITDQGKGFDWRAYLNLCPNRMMDPNGRGIATAKFSFTTMEYVGKGNEVVCTIARK